MESVKESLNKCSSSEAERIHSRSKRAGQNWPQALPGNVEDQFCPGRKESGRRRPAAAEGHLFSQRFLKGNTLKIIQIWSGIKKRATVN
jgi:hypothetical protein